MPSLQIPAELEEAIGKFTSVDLRDEAKLEAYSDVAELLSGYLRNAKQYALYPKGTKKFAESVNKSLRTLEIYLEMITYNEVFTQCVKQWKETTEHIIEFLTDLTKSLDELRLIAATTSKPVSSRDITAKATILKPVMLGRTILPADEQVTIAGEPIDKTGFLQVNTASGEMVDVPLINLKAAGESTELLTFFTSSVEKMKQCLDQIRKEVTPKFWAIARSYFQSRSKQEPVTIADSKRWKQATDMLLKLDDNSTGFSFKSCIGGISSNASEKKLPDAFEITQDEVESLYDFVRLYQLLLNLLMQASASLGYMDQLWGEDWQKSLRVSSLLIQSATDQQPRIQQETAMQVISNLSGTMGLTSSEYRHSQSVQQQTTTRRIITTTNSVEINASSLESYSQQHQQSYRSMRSADGLLQLTHRGDATDAAKDDIHRVSRSSSVVSESERWQQGQIRGGAAFASPLPSPVLMSARMQARESRRGIMDDSCSYEVKQSEVKTMTDSVTIISDEDVMEQRAQLQQARRLITKMENKSPKTEAACQTEKFQENLAKVQTSVRTSTRSDVTDAGCFSNLTMLTSSVRAGKSQVTDAGCFSDCVTLTSSARVGKESIDHLVQFHRDAPVTNCGANLEIDLKNGFVNYQKPEKTFLTNNVSIGKVLIEQSMRFQEDRTVAVSSTHVSKIVDTVAQFANAKVDHNAGNCRTQTVEAMNAGVKWQPDAGNSSMLSLGKPIVDNGVFRINELIDSWTDMPTNKAKESGAHYIQARKDARTQKNPTRTPQVECGVGDNLYLIGGTDMSVQTAGTRGVTDCGVSVADQGVSTTDGGAGKRSRTRGTDMSERHTICDTGACASTNRVIKIVAEELALHRLKTPQQQDPSKPQREPEPAKPTGQEHDAQPLAPQQQQQQQQPNFDARKSRTQSLHYKQPPLSNQTPQPHPEQQQYPPNNQSRNSVDNSKPGLARTQSTRNVGYPASRSQLV